MISTNRPEMESRPYEFLLQHDLFSVFTQKEREF